MHLTFTQEELALIGGQRIRSEEINLYFILRTFADFKTGLFSHWSTKKVNLTYLAERMMKESSQGRAAITYSHTAIRRMLDSLSGFGLVADVSREGRSLKMRLPMVESGRKEWEEKTEEKSGQNGKADKKARPVATEPVPAMTTVETVEVVHAETEKDEMLRTSAETLEFVETPVTTGLPTIIDEPVFEDLSDDEDGSDWMLSNAKTEESSETLAARGFADVSETSFSTKEPSQHKNQNLERTRERESLPSASETRQVHSENPTHHAATRLAGKTENEEREDSVALPQDEWMFPSLLRKISGKSILYAFSEKSKSIYHGWKLCGFSLDDIERAFYKVIERKMLITPDSVDTVLRKPVKKVKGSWKPVKKDQTKGRLAL